MCGIFGVLSDAGNEDLERTARQAVGALSHRGPDGHGFSIGRHQSFRCLLAHTRLAVLDISGAGSQPMSTDDGRFTIVLNGEIYNFREIRALLEASGVRFRSGTDTEVVLHAYAAWGLSCLPRLRGMFAFAIWDSFQGELVLARDRLGIKPLYYRRNSSGVAFASEVRALLETGLAERRLSPKGLTGYLLLGSVPEPASILSDVYALDAGSYAVFTAQNFKARRYWTLPDGPATIQTMGEAAEELAPVLREAVRLHLVSDVPLGVFLSGGMDSAAMLALATKELKGQVRTFTVVFEEREYDEATKAEWVSSRFQSLHTSVRLPVCRAASELPKVLEALDQPSSDGLNTFFVAKAAKEAGLTVALSGLGGDELFAGYPNFRSFRRLLRQVDHAGRILPLFVRRALFDPISSGLLLPNRIRKAVELLTGSGEVDRLYLILRAMFSPAQCKRLVVHDMVGELRATLPEIPGSSGRAAWTSEGDAINLLSRVELANYLKNTLLRDSDAMSMAHALEVRVPFLDHVLLERVQAVAGHLKTSPDRNKPLLAASVPELPAELSSDKKRGFNLPLGPWFRGPMRPAIEELLFDGALAELGVIEPGRVEKLWAGFLRGESVVSSSRIWCLAALSGWCARHRVRA